MAKIKRNKVNHHTLEEALDSFLISVKEKQLSDFSFLEEETVSSVSGESFQEIFGQLKEKMSKK